MCASTITERLRQQITGSSTLVMGVLNVTPDSFSDGYQTRDADAMASHAVERARQMIAEGVDIIDIGGESTRPHADFVDAATEIKRIVPVIQAIRQFSDVPISVDSYKPEVMQTSVSAGANMLNDIKGAVEPTTQQVMLDADVPVCLMHMRGTPQTMHKETCYDDVFSEVSLFLKSQADQLVASGLNQQSIVLDPGFGFAKHLEHNMQLFRRLGELCHLGYPTLVGVSRKSMIGQITNKSLPANRMVTSVVAAVLAAMRGVRIVRVHDVAETKDALTLVRTLSESETTGPMATAN